MKETTTYQVPLDLFVKQVARHHHEFPVTRHPKHQKWLLDLPGTIRIVPSPSKPGLIHLAKELYHQQAIRGHTFLETVRNFLTTLGYSFLPMSLPKKQVDFVFLIHTRYVEDYKSVFPFLSWIKRVSAKLYVKLIQSFPPCIIDQFESENGVRGILVSTPLLPDTLMKERKRTELEIARVKKLLAKYCAPNPRKIVIGLGGWWPMVSNKGKLFEASFTQREGYRVTTGHTATVFSLVTSAWQLIEKSGIQPEQINVAILGCGNIGRHTAEFLLDHGVHVTLIDINLKKLRHLRRDLREMYPNERIHTALFTTRRIKRILSSCHLGVCATSNVGAILTLSHIPKHFIFIDDSRPEAIPRFKMEDKRYTIEGGLLRVPGLRSRFNFGFGNDANFLGCLSEAYLLAWDSVDTRMVADMGSNVDAKNFRHFSRFCLTHGITRGAYKMGSLHLDELLLAHAVQKRHRRINPS